MLMLELGDGLRTRTWKKEKNEAILRRHCSSVERSGYAMLILFPYLSPTRPASADVPGSLVARFHSLFGVWLGWVRGNLEGS